MDYVTNYKNRHDLTLLTHTLEEQEGRKIEGYLVGKIFFSQPYLVLSTFPTDFGMDLWLCIRSRRAAWLVNQSPAKMNQTCPEVSNLVIDVFQSPRSL